MGVVPLGVSSILMPTITALYMPYWVTAAVRLKRLTTWPKAPWFPECQGPLNR